MPLILYPILLTVAVIIIYIFGKKSSPNSEPIESYETYEEDRDDINFYDDETEESYLLRCQNSIVALFNQGQVPYLVDSDHRYYQIKLAGHDDFHNEIQIVPYFANGKKYINLETVISSVIIPNDKLSAVSELINRINFEILFGGLSLDYSTRTLYFRITYKVGDQIILPQYFWFNVNLVNDAVTFVPYFERVIRNNEEPALVILDYVTG